MARRDEHLYVTEHSSDSSFVYMGEFRANMGDRGGPQ